MKPVERSAPRAVHVLKHFGNLIAFVLVLPLVAFYRVGVWVSPRRKDNTFQGCSQLVSLIPGFTGVFLRRAFYRRTLTACSPRCHIGFGTLFATPEVRIGHDVYIGARCMIAHADIGDDTLIGSNVDILAGRHQHRFERLDVPIRLQGGQYEPVTIGRDVWIGNGATVIADVGDQAIVATRAVVLKPVTARTIVGGNPARQITDRT